MLRLDFVLVIAFALGVTTLAILDAPEGYEDDAGFHFTDDRLNR
jgi:hypothetical protein